MHRLLITMKRRSTVVGVDENVKEKRDCSFSGSVPGAQAEFTVNARELEAQLPLPEKRHGNSLLERKPWYY